MLSKEEKKEILEDAYNPEIGRRFQEAERKCLEWLKNHPEARSLDNYITFLDSLQEVIGPFPVSRDLPSPPHDFRL